MTNHLFLVAGTDSSRPADYHLGYMDGCIFLDFNNCDDGRVYLVRVSFDGYGCCNLGANSIPLDEDNSRTFKDIFLNNIEEQNAMATIVKLAIRLNKKLIWTDALNEYDLI